MFIKVVKDCKNLVKIWEIYMKDGLMRMLDVFYVEEISVL